jgi:hypothetical protein
VNSQCSFNPIILFVQRAGSPTKKAGRGGGWGWGWAGRLGKIP